MLFYCSKLIPLFDKDEKELKEVSMDDLNAQRKYWDNMIENPQVRMNNALACPPKVVPSVKLVVVEKERTREYDT